LPVAKVAVAGAVEFATAKPIRDSRTARAKNALYFLMALLLGKRWGLRLLCIF
jgi:hypothetical protein